MVSLESKLCIVNTRLVNDSRTNRKKAMDGNIRYLDNVPTAGIKVLRSINNHMAPVVVQDPRGFIYEISPHNFVVISQCCTIDHGVIKDACVYHISGFNNTLIPVNSEEYARLVAETAQLETQKKGIYLSPGVVLYHPTKGIGIYLGRHNIYYPIYKYNVGEEWRYAFEVAANFAVCPEWRNYVSSVNKHLPEDIINKAKYAVNLWLHERSFMKGKIPLGEYECMAYVNYPLKPNADTVLHYRIDMKRELKCSEFEKLVDTSERSYKASKGFTGAAMALDLFPHSDYCKELPCNPYLSVTVPSTNYYEVREYFDIISTDISPKPIFNFHGDRVCLESYKSNFRSRIKVDESTCKSIHFVPLQIL